MASASPTVRRREVGARLREFRLATGLTAEEVAARMEVSAAKISRIETGARGVSIADVRFLCEFYGASAEDRDRLLVLTRESKRRSWWQQHGLPETVVTYTGLEDAAVGISHYETSLLPGLLQTEDYARALSAGIMFDQPKEAVDQIVQARMIRQGRLAEPRPPELWVVLDEAALWRIVGGPSIMRRQLAHLVERAHDPNITLQVIPFDAGAHPALNSAFEILHLEEVSDVVYVEGLLGHFFLQSETDLNRYRRAFDQLRAVALSPRASKDLIDAIASKISA